MNLNDQSIVVTDESMKDTIQFGLNENSSADLHAEDNFTSRLIQIIQPESDSILV